MTVARKEASRREPSSGWRLVKLGRVCSLVNGDAYKESDWASSGVPIIRIQNLNDQSKPFNYWQGSLNGRVKVSTGDVLLGWSGTPGTSFGAHIWYRQAGVLNQHIFRVDFDRNMLMAEWAVHAINQQLDVLIRKAHGGVGLRHVTRKEVDSLEIPLPPLAEQRRLTAILRNSLNSSERARKVTSSQLEDTQALPGAYLRQAFPEPGQPLPPGWSLVKLGDFANLLPSRSLASDGDIEVCAITTASLTELGFNASGIKTGRMRAIDVSECTVTNGEVLVARSNTSELVGRAALYDGKPDGVVASDLTIRIKTGRDLRPDYLARYLSSLFLRGYWRNHAGGTSGTMKKITRRQIETLHLPICDVQEQEHIERTLNWKMEVVAKLRAQLEAQLEDINKLPGSLLRMAFSGGL